MEMRRGWLEEFSRGQGGVESRGVEGGGGPKCCERLRASALNPQKFHGMYELVLHRLSMLEPALVGPLT